MVQTVVLPDVLESLGRFSHVRGPVHKGIQEVAQEEPREKSPGVRPDAKKGKNRKEDQEKGRGHDQARYRRHEQALLVARVQVMRTVHHEMESLDVFVIRYPVKQVAMQHVFGKCPEKKGKDEQTDELNDRNSNDGKCIVDQGCDDGTVNDDILPQGGSRQAFQHGVLENGGGTSMMLCGYVR